MFCLKCGKQTDSSDVCERCRIIKPKEKIANGDLPAVDIRKKQNSILLWSVFGGIVMVGLFILISVLTINNQTSPSGIEALPASFDQNQPTCSQDNWECGDWSSCQEGNPQERICTKTYDCPSVNTPSPVTTQSCIFTKQNTFYEDLLSTARNNLQAKQANLDKTYNFATHNYFQLDAVAGKAIFSNPVAPDDKIVADVQIIGAISSGTDSKLTWEWSWNSNEAPTLSKDILVVKRFGQTNDKEIIESPLLQASKYNPLVVGSFQTNDSVAQDMAAIALDVLGGEGVYRKPVSDSSGTIIMYILIKRFERSDLDMQCEQLHGPSIYKVLSKSIGGGAYCDCKPDYKEKPTTAADGTPSFWCVKE